MTWSEKKELCSILADELGHGRQLAVLMRAQVREQCQGWPETTAHKRSEPGMPEETDPEYGDSTEWSQLFAFENEVVRAPGKSRHTLTRKQSRKLHELEADPTVCLTEC